MKFVKVLRGLPGSGKSTWVNRNFKDGEVVVCCADDYHVGENGVYLYDPKRAGEAHARCLCKFLDALRDYNDNRPIIVANTNTRVFELAPYVQAAIAYGDCEILYFPCSVEDAIKRNVHGVPEATILAMQGQLYT